MKKLSKLAVAVAAWVALLTTNARALDLINVNDNKEVVSSGPTTVSSPSATQLLKTNRNHRLTVAQFIEYIEEVEALNPNATPQQIVTMFHHGQYAKDEGVPLPLFAEGEENSGWEDVKLPNGTVPPKFITDNSGKLVDIAHSYAGVRGGLNRSGINRWAMKNVNTGWGDSLQVVNGYILGARNYLSGDFSEGNKQFSNAKNFKPEDQIRGNNLGIQVESYLREHKGTTLSQAYSACLVGSTKGTDIHDDIFYAAAVSPLAAVVKKSKVSSTIVKSLTGQKIASR